MIGVTSNSPSENVCNKWQVSLNLEAVDYQLTQFLVQGQFLYPVQICLCAHHKKIICFASVSNTVSFFLWLDICFSLHGSSVAFTIPQYLNQLLGILL